MRLLVLLVLASALSPLRAGSDLPPLPLGYDAYLRWDQWHLQRIGLRTYMRSTYDRTGGNEAADASHFLYQHADDNNVTLDVEGAGVLAFVRTNHWHGSPWRYVVDGRESIITETSTADPDHPVANSKFLPEGVFQEPLAWTWSTTKGADLNWTPIPFLQGLRLGYSRTHYGTGYYIFQMPVPGMRLSRSLETWRAGQPADKRVLDLLSRAGTDIAPKPDSREGRRRQTVSKIGTVEIQREGATTLFHSESVPTLIRALRLSVPRDRATALGRCRIRITWDDRAAPSVDTPLPLFFGAGVLYNRDNREYLVKALPVNIRYAADRVELACYFPMPYLQSARIEIIGNGYEAVPDVRTEVRTEPLKEPRGLAAYFHATYIDHTRPEPGKDLVLLDTRNAEGGGEWSGHFVGTSFIFSHNAVLTTLEGDPRFYFDDSRSPQCYGTGTEEWCGGGDYWGGLNMTLPMAGHPTGAKSAKESQDDQDKIQSAYRFLLGDLMPFGRNARITLEHGGTNDSSEHYETVAYWYGSPTATLVQTDELKIGDAPSERHHDYRSPDASAPYSILSRYEWGVDHLRGKEIFPAHTETARKTKSSSEFTLSIDPQNAGVLLRRTLDYSLPNQRAEVFVSDPKRAKPVWQPAGIWYTAGSNTCVYSNPREELGATQHVVQTSNRRFRDDEFLLPLSLTKGRSAIRVRVKFTPVGRPLFPGNSLPEEGWTEIRYSAYCWRAPGRTK
jgi:hypothetical protein